MAPKRTDTASTSAWVRAIGGGAGSLVVVVVVVAGAAEDVAVEEEAAGLGIYYVGQLTGKRTWTVGFTQGLAMQGA